MSPFEWLEDLKKSGFFKDYEKPSGDFEDVKDCILLSISRMKFMLSVSTIEEPSISFIS